MSFRLIGLSAIYTGKSWTFSRMRILVSCRNAIADFTNKIVKTEGAATLYHRAKRPAVRQYAPDASDDTQSYSFPNGWDLASD
jgi:hypothetical protein